MLTPLGTVEAWHLVALFRNPYFLPAESPLKFHEEFWTQRKPQPKSRISIRGATFQYAILWQMAIVHSFEK
jgi:hypothetical protein